MYVPKHFALHDDSALRFIRENGFAVLVAPNFEAVHLPVMISQESPLVISGHVAKANPIWRGFDGESDHLLILHGPHAYISPVMYAEPPNVPTWNYVAVHARGKVRAIQDTAQAVKLLQDLCTFYDPDLAMVQPESLTNEYVTSMVGGIVAFEMTIEGLEGKAKVSQNRKPDDRQRVRKALAEAGNPIAEWMVPLSP